MLTWVLSLGANLLTQRCSLLPGALRSSVARQESSSRLTERGGANTGSDDLQIRGSQVRVGWSVTSDGDGEQEQLELPRAARAQRAWRGLVLGLV